MLLKCDDERAGGCELTIAKDDDELSNWLTRFLVVPSKFYDGVLSATPALT